MKFKIINYLGSKAREIKYIVQDIEEDLKKASIIVDVFGGCGIVGFTLADTYGLKCHYNDLNKHLFDLYSNLDFVDECEGFYEKCEKMTDEEKRQLFEDVKLRKIDISPNLRYVYLSMTCYRGIIGDTVDIRPNMRKVNGINVIEDRIKSPAIMRAFRSDMNALSPTITNETYKVILEQYKDDETAILYLDPPYIGHRMTTYETEEFLTTDLLWIKEFMDVCACKVILNIDYTCFSREIVFPAYYKFFYAFNYLARLKNNKSIKTFHAIFRNF